VINLREIAESLNAGKDSHVVSHRNTELAALLNAVVEERAKVIRVTQRQGGIPEPKVLTVAESKEVALHELNLEGVWPVKKDAND